MKEINVKFNEVTYKTNKQTNSVTISPQANYTD
jgi:hypothetical protein